MKFEPFPKVPRLCRTVTVTEKIDGTNAGVWIGRVDVDDAHILHKWDVSGVWFGLRASSRKRWLTLENDNFGFANWVIDNVDRIKNLGEGMHFGEWWGRGIQRGYGLDHKRFSLFNTARWKGGNDPAFTEHTACHVVPVLAVGELSMILPDPIGLSIDTLNHEGSIAAPGYDDPEGIMVWHAAAQQMFKWTFDGDQHKEQDVLERPRPTAERSPLG